MDPSRRVPPEMLERVSRQAELSPSYLVLMGLAGILAAAALLTNSVPILIGAMIVAPAFAPLALIAFALVGGQPQLALRGVGIAFLGLLTATVLAMLTTWLLNVTNVLPPGANLLEKPLLEERVRPGWYSVLVALAAGVAGTLALAEEKIDTVIGTVAALALVPAAAAAAITFLSRDPLRGFGGLLLLLINVSAIILTGVGTLLVLRPGAKRE